MSSKLTGWSSYRLGRNLMVSSGGTGLSPSCTPSVLNNWTRACEIIIIKKTQTITNNQKSQYNHHSRNLLARQTCFRSMVKKKKLCNFELNYCWLNEVFTHEVSVNTTCLASTKPAAQMIGEDIKKKSTTRTQLSFHAKLLLTTNAS